MSEKIITPDLVAIRPQVRGHRGRGIARGRSLLGVVPFFAYVTIFLFIPTLVVVIGAFAGDNGGITASNLSALGQDKFVVHKLFEEVAPRYTERPGGYTRIVKLGPRRSDSTEMVFLELV